MRIENHATQRRRISLTPLIDVVFLLLLFFMLASTFTKHFEIPLASAGPAELAVDQKSQPLLVRLHAGGHFDVNGVGLGTDHLSSHLSTLDVRFLQTAIVQVRAGATTQDLVSLLARLKEAGVKNSIVTR